MSKERVRESREDKLDRAANTWQYNRFGVDEKPIQVVKSTVLFDEGAAERAWKRNRFGIEE